MLVTGLYPEPRGNEVITYPGLVALKAYLESLTSQKQYDRLQKFRGTNIHPK